MTATTTIRHTVRARIVELLRASTALGGVQIEHGWPGDLLESESIWLGETEGDIEIPAMQAGRKQRDDKFTVPVVISAGKPGQSMDEAAARGAALFGAVESLLADEPALDDLDGVVAATASSGRGPLTVRTQEGAVNFAELVISVHSRLA